MFKRALLTFVFIALAAPAWALNVTPVTTPKGLTAWLVEDHSLPTIALSFYWRGGVEQDGDARQGESYLAGTLLTRGAGADDANAFQKKLAENAVAISFSTVRDGVYGQFRTLTETLPQGEALLKAAITAPQFADDVLARQKAELASQRRIYASDADWLNSRLMFSALFAGHPYSVRTLGTERTVAALTRADLQKWAATRLARNNVIIGITGDITPQNAAALIDRLFGSLPEKAATSPVAEAQLQAPGAIELLPHDGPQTVLTAVWPGIPRLDKDWYAGEVLNYILGGGSFSSRLMAEIRVKRALTYGISSSFMNFDAASLFTVEASCANENAGQVVTLMQSEIDKIKNSDVDAQELQAAKDYLIGAYALDLTSTIKVAGYLAELQRQHLSADEQQKRAAAIAAVTPADIRRVAARVFVDGQRRIFMVGHPVGVVATKTLQTLD